MEGLKRGKNEGRKNKEWGIVEKTIMERMDESMGGKEETMGKE